MIKSNIPTLGLVLPLKRFPMVVEKILSSGASTDELAELADHYVLEGTDVHNQMVSIVTDMLLEDIRDEITSRLYRRLFDGYPEDQIRMFIHSDAARVRRKIITVVNAAFMYADTDTLVVSCFSDYSTGMAVLIRDALQDGYSCIGEAFSTKSGYRITIKRKETVKS